MEFVGARMRQLIISVLWASAACPALVLASDAHYAPRASPDHSASLLSDAFPPGKQPRQEPISPAILAIYYEHMREHAPPRRNGGAMQRRENFYRAPAEPFELLKSHLGSSAADLSLASDLANLHDAWERGISPDSKLIESLRKHAVQSSLTADPLLEAARGIQWLIDEKTAAAFFAAGLEKARLETQSWHLSEPEAAQMLHALDQSACLWRFDEPTALIDRFTVARRLTPPMSVESRRAGYLLAEALRANERRDEAAELILKVCQEHLKVGDLGRDEPAEISEMNFVTGFMLFDDGRFSDAIQYLRVVDGEHADNARHLLFEAYVRTSDFADAQAMLKSNVPAKGQPFQPIPVSAELKEEMDRARWRAEIGTIPDPPR
jgi:hypothetical protein